VASRSGDARTGRQEPTGHLAGCLVGWSPDVVLEERERASDLAREFDLSQLPDELHPEAWRALLLRDGVGLIDLFSRVPEKLVGSSRIYLVARNVSVLRNFGIYEDALLRAFTFTPSLIGVFPPRLVRYLFDIADRAKLRAVGDPRPGPGPFTLYRGVASGRYHERGLSWTSDPEVASWFAAMHGKRPSNRRRGAPRIVTCSFDEPEILCFTNRRVLDDFEVDGRLVRNKRESEFIVHVSPTKILGVLPVGRVRV
jgi:hypothetical protein